MTTPTDRARAFFKCLGSEFHTPRCAKRGDTTFSCEALAAEFEKVAQENKLAGMREASDIARKNERHVENSPGVGDECQRYGIAVAVDIRMDIGQRIESVEKEYA